MSPAELRLLPNAVFYSPLPALVLDAEHRIVDHSVALEALVGHDLSGCRGRPLGEFLRIFTDRVDGPMIAPQLKDRDDGPPLDGPAQCILHTEAFGQVRLACTPLEYRDLAVGRPAGVLVLWEVRQVEREDAYHERYRRLLDHQLTWDTYAWSYDRIISVMPYYREVLDRHVAAMRDSGDGSVVDLGAGTGNLAALLVRECRRVVAVDYSRAMLDRLRGKLVDHIGRGLEVIEANAEYLPNLRDGAFAGVSILLALYDMERPSDALDEAIRLLRRGGTLIITEPKLVFDLEVILGKCREHLDQIGRYDELAADLERVNTANRVLNPSSRETHADLHAEAIRERLVGLGFCGVTMTDSHFGQCATVRGIKP